MNFNDIVGFLITIAAVFYMFIKRAQDGRRRHESEEDHEEGQGEILEDFLKSLKADMEKSEDFNPVPKPKKEKRLTPPPSPPQPKKSPPSFQEEFKFKSDLDDFRMQTNIEGRKLKLNIKNRFEGDDYGEHLVSPEFRGEKMPEVVGRTKPSRIQKLIRSLPNKKDFILLNEVLNPPKGRQ